MLSDIFEKLVHEFNKQENQKQIKEFTDPYINKYNSYLYIIIVLLLITTLCSIISVFILIKNTGIKLKN